MGIKQPHILLRGSDEILSMWAMLGQHLGSSRTLDCQTLRGKAEGRSHLCLGTRPSSWEGGATFLWILPCLLGTHVLLCPVSSANSYWYGVVVTKPLWFPIVPKGPKPLLDCCVSVDKASLPTSELCLLRWYCSTAAWAALYSVVLSIVITIFSTFYICL